MNLYPHALNQGRCNLCGWISGAQALSSRVAIVTDNYQPWSIQNIIRCSQSKICKGTHPYRVNTILSKHLDYIILEKDNPFVGKACEKYNNCTCISAMNSSSHYLLRNIQWFFIGPNVRAENVTELEKALQFGPVTTCFTRNNSKSVGDQCSSGCKHANTIIGYDKDKWYLQESYGPNYKYPKKNPILTNGTWFAYRNTSCERALLEKTYYPKVFFDYDKANAYFTAEAVNENDIILLNKSSINVYPADFINIGMAKMRCSLLGNKCKGVTMLSSGNVELIESISASNTNSTNASMISIFRKTQMVIYLRHSGGQYLGIKKQKSNYILTPAANVSSAAPFFISNARIISFQYPDYLLANWAKLKYHNVSIPEYKTFWKLENANLKNIASGLSMDVDQDGKITGTDYKPDSISQRFNLYLSGEWAIYSRGRKQSLKEIKESTYKFADMLEVQRIGYLRWQSRQVVTRKGKPFNSSWKLGDGYLNIAEKDNHVAPTDTELALQMGNKRYLGLQSGRVVHFAKPAAPTTRWNMEYGNL